jgi:hypothetical protein
MRKPILFCLALLPFPAQADDSQMLKAKMQALMDAVAPGNKAPWVSTLDPRYVSTDETGEIADYNETIAQIVPLPKGSSGTIAVTEWKATIFGDCAVSTEVDDEHENFHGQNIHALYRATATWTKSSGDWKLIAMQTMALRQDPPAVELPGALLDSYIGRYRVGPGYTYTISQSDGRLYGTTNDGRPAELRAEIADVLFTPGQPRTRKIFRRDAAGKVTGFVSRREERDVLFTKEK